MTRWILVAAVLAGATALPGCATQPEPAQANAQAARCVAVTGTSVCRREGTGNTNNVQSVSGQDLQRQGGDIVRPASGGAGN